MTETNEAKDRRRQKEAFEKMAPELGFALKQTSFDVGEHTDIGLFLGPLASPVMSYDTADDETPSNADDKAVEDCITGWETLSPTDYVGNYTQFANESYLLLCAEAIGHVTGGAEESNTEFQETLQNYRPVVRLRLR